MKLIVVPIVIAVATLAVACSSSTTAKPTSTGVPASTPTPVSAQAFPDAATAAADSALLVASDFPVGWSGTPRTSQATPGFSGECAPFGINDPYPGSVVNKTGDDFRDTQNPTSTSGSHIDVFRTAALASDSFTRSADLVSRCHDQLLSVFKGLPEALAGSNNDASVANFQASFGDLPGVPALGDATRGYRFRSSFTLNGTPASGMFDVIVIQRGRLIGEVDYDTFDGNTQLRDSLAATMAARLTTADRQLPP